MAWYPRSVADLGLSDSLIGVLESAQVVTVEDLLEILYQGPPTLNALPGMSSGLVEELIETLRAKSLIQ